MSQNLVEMDSLLSSRARLRILHYFHEAQQNSAYIVHVECVVESGMVNRSALPIAE